MNGSFDHPYSEPKAPVHIITGSAVKIYNTCTRTLSFADPFFLMYVNLFSIQGCSERHDTFKEKQPEWVAFTSSDYGFSKMTIHNKTHLSFQQISDDQVCYKTSK